MGIYMSYNPNGFKINAFHLFRVASKRKTIIIFTLILLIIILTASYISSLNNLLYQVNNARNFRLLEISIDNKLDESYILNTLYNTKYIVNITPIYAYGLTGNSLEYQNKKYNGDVILYANNPNSIPDIILGNKFQSNTKEIVCPLEHAQNKDIDYLEKNRKLINREILLNKPITITYLNKKTKEMVSDDFLVVGFYKNTNNDDKLICYLDNTEMIDLMYDKQNYHSNNYLALVDHIEHLSLVKRDLSDLGIPSKEVSSINITYYKSIRAVLMAVLIFTIVIFLIISYIILESEYLYVIPNFNFIHVIGYTFTGIFITYVKFNTLVWLISVFLSALIAEIYASVFRKLAEVWPSLCGNIIIKMNYPILLLVSLIFLFMIILCTIINRRKIVKEKVCLSKIKY